jgi:bacillithiol system protein YtxJ
MNWVNLTDLSQLETIRTSETPVIIFKHSTRCSISRAALNRLERNWTPDEMRGVTLYFLDLLSHRQLSDAIADLFSVPHESPQVLVIRNGKSVYAPSHFDILYEKLKAAVRN